MKTRLYVCFDRTAEESYAIGEWKNDGVAYRAFQKAMMDDPFSDEKCLLHIGEIDHETSIISPCAPREVVPGVSMADDIEDGV